MFNAQQMNPADHARSTVSWWMFLARVGAVSAEVFMHKRFGSRYCRGQAFMVLPLGGAYAWMWSFNGYDVRPLMAFFGAYVVALVIAQIAIVIRLRRGDQEHSYYNGYPWMLRRSLAARQHKVKLLAEPLIVGGIGMLVNDYNLPLGIYLMFAACSLFVCNLMFTLWQRSQVVDMQDAVFEQQTTASRFRSSFGR